MRQNASIGLYLESSCWLLPAGMCLTLLVQEDFDVVSKVLTSTDCFSVACLDEWWMWLIGSRGAKNDTCNIRMAAIKGLLEYIGGRAPHYAYLYVAAAEHIKPMRTAKVKVCRMSRAAVKALFAEPDTNVHIGIRDLVLMILSYGVAGRINEILSLKLSDVHLEAQTPYVTLHGKGGTNRLSIFRKIL